MVITSTYSYYHLVDLLCLILTTRFSGNLILELDNQPAMSYLLSSLPTPSEAEKVTSIPLIAKLHESSRPLGSPYVRVLGGSKSRGGIALDPLVGPGRLLKGMKVQFARLRQAYLPSVKRPQNGIYVQLEVLSHLRYRWKEGWQKAGLMGSDKYTAVGFAKQQRYKGLPEFTVSRRLDYQGVQIGLFGAGSEGGFLVGQAGVVPWLCRTQGSRVQAQITAHQRGKRRTPVATRPHHRVSTKAHMAYMERRKALRNFLKEGGLIISKRVIFLDNRRWTTVPYLRLRRLTPSQRRRAQMEEKAHLEYKEKRRQVTHLALKDYQRRIQKEGVKRRMQNSEELKDEVSVHVSERMSPSSKESLELHNKKDQTPADSERKYRSKPFIESTRPMLFSDLFPKKTLPRSFQRLFEEDPVIRRILVKRAAEGRTWHKLFHRGGARKFGFRARSTWMDLRFGGFRRSGHIPGGFQLRNLLESQDLRAMQRDRSRITETGDTRNGGNRKYVVKEIMEGDGTIFRRKNKNASTVENASGKS